MTIEIIAIIAVVVSIGAAFLFFVLARRVFKLAIRLFLAFAIVLVVAGAALWFGWYRNSDGNPSTQQNRPTNTRRGNSR